MTENKDVAVTVDPNVIEASRAPVVAETKVTVMRTVKLDGVDTDSASSEETIEVHVFVTTPAIAVVTLPIKISRNYQSIGIEIGAYVPCYKEELPDGIEYAYQLVKAKAMEELPGMKKALEEALG